MQRIKDLLLSRRRNLYLFYLLTAVTSFYFIAGNWIYFYTKYMTFGQLGWVDAAAFGFATLLEVPSGAIADLIGKRKTILIGAVSGAIGVFMITFSGNFAGVFIGWLITQIFYAFYSGAAEALAYDTLVDLKQEESFDHVISKSAQISTYVGAITTFLGGFFYILDFRLPHIMWGIGYIFAILFAYLLIEPKSDKEKFSFKVYGQQLFVGIRELMSPGLRKYLGFFFVLIGIYYMYSWGFMRPAIATSFGFGAIELGTIIPILTIVAGICIKYIPRIKKTISELTGVIIMAIMMIVGFWLCSLPIGVYGIIAMALIAIAGNVASPWISIIVNKRITSGNRATTLSTMALISRLPYVIVAGFAGKMIEEGHLATFNFSTAIFIMIITLVSLLVIKMKKTFSLTH